MTKGWEISDKRKALFELKEGENVYLALGRQMEIARPHELAALYMMRSGDEAQKEAMMLVQEAKTAVWTRRAVFAAVLSVPLNGLVAFLVTR